MKTPIPLPSPESPFARDTIRLLREAVRHCENVRRRSCPYSFVSVDVERKEKPRG